MGSREGSVVNLRSVERSGTCYGVRSKDVLKGVKGWLK